MTGWAFPVQSGQAQKCWINPHGHMIKTNSVNDIIRCPYLLPLFPLA